MPEHVQFEVGDAVKVNYLGVDMYGTLKWQGDLPDGEDMAGIEMVSLLSMPRLVKYIHGSTGWCCSVLTSITCCLYSYNLPLNPY